MAPKWIPKWLHFQLLFALVFDPIFDPPPNLLFAQTDPPRGAQGTEKTKKNPKMELKRDPKLRCCSIFALLEPPGARLAPQRPPEAPKTSFSLILAPFLPPQASVLSIFGSHFRPARAQAPPRTAKNRREPPRTCRNTKPTTTHRTKVR